MSAATAVGIGMGYGDISSGLWLCLPLVALEGEDRLYLARRIDWQANAHNPESGLTSVDDDELEEVGIMLPIGERRAIEPGWALAVMGDDFAQAMKDAEVACSDDVSAAHIPNETYSVGLATVESFERFRATICSNASAVFDKALSFSLGYGLSRKGRAALRVLRHSAHRRSDLAVRELAGAIVSQDLDLLRRLLTRYSIELQESREGLESKARQHIAWCEPTERARATHSGTDRDVIWKQRGASISPSHLESQLVGVWQMETSSEPLVEHLIVRDVRGVNELAKPRSIKLRAYPKGQAIPWEPTVRREVNQRRGLHYTDVAVSGISRNYFVEKG